MGAGPSAPPVFTFYFGAPPPLPLPRVCVCRASSLPALSLPKGDTPLHLPPNFPLGTPLGGMAGWQNLRAQLALGSCGAQETTTPRGLLRSPGDYNSQRSIGRGSLLRPGLLVTTLLTNGFRSYTRSHTQRPIRLVGGMFPILRHPLRGKNGIERKNVSAQLSV